MVIPFADQSKFISIIGFSTKFELPRVNFIFREQKDSALDQVPAFLDSAKFNFLLQTRARLHFFLKTRVDLNFFMITLAGLNSFYIGPCWAFDSFFLGRVGPTIFFMKITVCNTFILFYKITEGYLKMYFFPVYKFKIMIF